MATILEQLDAATHDYFMIQGGKAADNYYETSFLLNYLLKQKKGRFETFSGGKKISVPLRYDGNTAGFFVRGGTLDSTKREAITNVNFARKFAYGNATIFWVDELANAGEAQIIDLLAEELLGAQESLRDVLATSLYTGLEGDTMNLTGLNSACDTTATVAYGGYASNDIVSQDGTKVWTGKGSSSATVISIPAIQAIRTASAYGKGKTSKPDFLVTTETNFDTLAAMLQVQQRFTEGSETVKAGFEGIKFEGAEIFPDRYCPASNMYAINSKHFGFAVHKDGNMARGKWQEIAGSAQDKTMKIYFVGNAVCDNRRSLYRHSSIS